MGHCRGGSEESGWIRRSEHDDNNEVDRRSRAGTNDFDRLKSELDADDETVDDEEFDGELDATVTIVGMHVGSLARPPSSSP